MKNKKLFIAGIAIFSVIVFLAIFLVVWYWGDKFNYKDFNDDFKTIQTDSGETLKIPGLDEGAVPQGMANYTYPGDNKNINIASQQYFFISAYMKKGASRVYVTGERTGYVGYVTLKNEDGSDYFGHAGGIATSCNNTLSNGQKLNTKYGTLWIVSDGMVYCAKASSSEYTNIAEEIIVKAALADGDKSIQFATSFKANNQADFCYYYDALDHATYGRLYVGEFYHPTKDIYSTPDNHHITTANGDKHYALVNEYSLSTSTSASNKYGLMQLNDNGLSDKNNVPKINQIISIPDKIQGFARNDSGQLVLSASYGLPNSHIYYYSWDEVTSTANRDSFKSLTGYNFEYDGVERATGVKYTDPDMKVYFADSSKLLRDYSIPSMAEGMCVNGDKIYVLFESGCYKYKAFVRERITDIYYFIPRV